MAGILDFFDFGALDLKDPSTLTGLGLQVAGTFLKQRQFNEVRKAQERLRANDAIRQQALQTEATERAKAATQRVSAAQQESDRMAIAKRDEQEFRPASSEAAIGGADFTSGNPGAPSFVGENIARQVRGAVGKGRDYAGAASRFGSYGGQAVNANTELTRLGQDIGRVANFSRGQSRVLPMSLQAQLQSRGRGYRSASDLANVMGRLKLLQAFEKGK